VGRIHWCGGSEWWDTSAADEEEKIEEVEEKCPWIFCSASNTGVSFNKYLFIYNHRHIFFSFSFFLF
jgi:hypothetical protein